MLKKNTYETRKNLYTGDYELAYIDSAYQKHLLTFIFFKEMKKAKDILVNREGYKKANLF